MRSRKSGIGSNSRQRISSLSETLSWRVAGAQAVGVDISAEQVRIAERDANEAGLSVRFVAADIYDLPAELQNGNFDLVYTGGGAIVWLPDLKLWASVIAKALKQHGRLILYEEHPIAACLSIEDGNLHLEENYFRRDDPAVVTGWYHFKGGESAKEMKNEFTWPIGDVITALAEAGLIIKRLEEYPSGAEWRFGEELDQVARLPGEYLLLAEKA